MKLTEDLMILSIFLPQEHLSVFGDLAKGNSFPALLPHLHW
jgi:hypothetical protein